MHVTIRKYPDCRNAKEVNRIAVAELLPVLRAVPGFRSYTIVDTGPGSILSIGVFDSEESAEAANARAREVVARTGMASLLPSPPEITIGELMSDAR
jgi:hypothetical protein